jgi:hypothetical protein
MVSANISLYFIYLVHLVSFSKTGRCNCSADKQQPSAYRSFSNMQIPTDRTDTHALIIQQDNAFIIRCGNKSVRINRLLIFMTMLTEIFLVGFISAFLMQVLLQ